ncbi:MAG: hypothetical protein KF858_11835 [Candidatus Sumerlaeia bacterium]|nr:hypothetical protein [Candidatus Sumerlaeia bacterium]
MPPPSVPAGPYVLGFDPRGIRITREVEGPVGEVRGLIVLTLTEQGQAPVPFTIERLMADPSPKGGIRLHGYVTDALAIDGRIQYDEVTEGLEFKLAISNSADDVHVRFGMYLELFGEAEAEWLIPGLFYNENKVRDCQHVYPSYSEIQRDPGRFVSNHWSFRCDRAALPAVLCETFGVVGFIATEEYAVVDDELSPARSLTSLGFSTEDGYPVLRMEAPYCEEPVKFTFCRPTGTDMEEHFTLLEEGRPLTLGAQVGLVPQREGARESVYRSLYRRWWAVQPPRPKVSSIGAQHLAIEGLVNWHLDEPRGMVHERAAFDRHYARGGSQVELPHMHVGWLSGVLPAYVLLWHGRDTTNPNYVRAGTLVIDRICSDLAPCGTLWSMFTVDEGPSAGAGPSEGLIHARTIGEAVLFLVRAMRLELQANTTHSTWFGAIASTLRFAVQNQLESGALPAYWEADTGEVQSYDGTAGLCWVAPLVACNHLVASNAYLDAARLAGEYYASFVEKGFLYGCVEDLPLVPTVDDCHMALIAYMLLYEADRSPRWLELARRAADLALTFRMAWNVTFDADTMLAQTGFMTRGGDIVSPAMPVLTANGLISYGELQKLSALTGDSYYGDRARESRTFATQLLARSDGEYNARRGQAIGQLFHTDWWQPKGMVLSLSYAWTLALVAHAELLEMHLAIPYAALTGDHQSVVEAASRTSVVELQKDLMMPESVEIRRQKELQARHSRAAVRRMSGVVVTDRVQQLGPDFEFQAPGAARASSPGVPTPARSSSSRIIPGPPIPPVRPGSSAWVPLDPPSERSIFPFEPPKTPPTPMPGKRIPPEVAHKETDFISRDQLPIAGMMPSSSATPPAKPKAPLQSRHTPLSPGEIEKGAVRDERPTHKLAPTAQIAQSDSPHARQSSGLKPLPPPPPELGKGLLANLMDDKVETPRFTPLSNDSVDEPLRPPTREEGMQSDDDDGEAPIKWKIF